MSACWLLSICQISSRNEEWINNRLLNFAILQADTISMVKKKPRLILSRLNILIEETMGRVDAYAVVALSSPFNLGYEMRLVELLKETQICLLSAGSSSAVNSARLSVP